MRDDLERLMREADGERALPEDVRARLEASLQDGVADVEASGLAAAMELDDVLSGVDRPRPVPDDVRLRVEQAMAAPPVDVGQRALATAATILILSATGFALLRSNPSESDTPFAGPSPTTLATASLDPGDCEPGEVCSSPRPRKAKPIFVPGAAPGVGTTGSGDAATEWGPPPYLAPGVLGGTRSSAPLAPYGIAIIRGDEQVEQGFRAYVDLLNNRGGIAGHPINLIPTSQGSTTPSGALATVNLAASSITAGGVPPWIQGPVIESLAATSESLKGQVYGFASPPERQAHLVADAMYPSAVGDTVTAVVYHEPSGVFGEAVPDAIEEVLDARGVTVVRSVVQDTGSPIFVPADVAFLSLSTERARAWFTASNGANYRPDRAIAGIYSLMDRALAKAMRGQAVRIVSPYALPLNAETPVATGAPPDLDIIHGWTTAKSLAVALWRNPPTEGSGMTDALANLTGFDAGFAPPFAVRAGSNARTPEGVLYRVTSSGFEQMTGFLRDPF